MLKPIRNKTDYLSSLDQAYTLMQKDLKKNTEEAALLNALTILIEAYEKEHFPIAPPHPIDAILFRLEQLKMTTADLKRYLGYRSRVSDILSGRRKLSLDMIRILHEQLGIPAEVLIMAYTPKKRDVQKSKASEQSPSRKTKKLTRSQPKKEHRNQVNSKKRSY